VLIAAKREDVAPVDAPVLADPQPAAPELGARPRA
jgi:hypothetical protein